MNKKIWNDMSNEPELDSEILLQFENGEPWSYCYEHDTLSWKSELENINKNIESRGPVVKWAYCYDIRSLE